jgi:glycosyltransferase involved in cell wall biosynthesis
LSAEKGHVGLIEAFAVARKGRAKAELVLVGDGPGKQAIEQSIAANDLRDNVVLRGRLDESATLLEIAKSDVLVLPSLIEGLPIVLMEAMALGVPVVASRVAGVPELVEDEKEGLLFTPGKWDELGAQIARLMHCPSLREGLARAARQKVEASFEIGGAVGPLADKLRACASAGQSADRISH